MRTRRTKIIATLGPASRSEPVARSLIEAGVDAFRLNFSYGSHDEHAQAIQLIRLLSRDAGRPVAVIQDLQGPKIRVGRLPNGAFRVEQGDRVAVVVGASQGTPKAVPVSEPALAAVVARGDHLLLGDGEVELDVESASGSVINTRAVEGGLIREGQGVNAPGAALPLPAITPKDERDLELGLTLGVDYVALSFVRTSDDIRRLKQFMRAQGATVPVIAKLEKREGVDAFEDILRVADGVMIARGDLGLELPPEQVPLLQKRMIRRANESGRLVITATQMLESMVNSPRPTRAEASDVANAVFDGSDAVMLSAETAVGQYPAQAVRMMARIAAEAEGEARPSHSERLRISHAHALSRAARQLANDVGAAAIVIFTRSGFSARLMSKERPLVPVLAFSPSQAVRQQLALCWGVTSLAADFPVWTEETVARADRYLLDQGLLRPGDTVIMARWAPQRRRGWANFLKLHRLGRPS